MSSVSAVDARPMLRIAGLRKSFPGTRRAPSKPVLDGIDLEVGRGECVVLIGASGSGKSTLLRCIDLLEQVDDGVIELDGDDITDPRVDADDVRARMGMVFQAYNLFPHLSVVDNVALASVRVHGVPAPRARERAVEMLGRVGLADRAASRPDELSGGQQQRVAIARAMVNDPKVLLLDEVTSALDPELVGEVLDLLRELRDEGVTMIVSTHEMGFARQVADTVCFLDGGRIIERGRPEQALDHPREARTRQFLSRLSL